MISATLALGRLFNLPPDSHDAHGRAANVRRAIFYNSVPLVAMLGNQAVFLADPSFLERDDGEPKAGIGIGAVQTRQSVAVGAGNFMTIEAAASDDPFSFVGRCIHAKVAVYVALAARAGSRPTSTLAQALAQLPSISVSVQPAARSAPLSASARVRAPP